MIDRAALKAIPLIYRPVQLYRYLMFQPKLAAAVLRDWQDRHNNADGPVPPAKLRYRVHGALDKEGFLRNGRVIARNIEELLALTGRTFYSFERILDFGSRSARVLRNFADAPPSCQLYGTDIDRELVSWCERRLPGIHWSLNGALPPAPFASETFDLIYSISVFTHLDEEFQHAWLRELSRIARPGAILVLTVHGERVYRTLTPSEQKRLHSSGFLFLSGATGRLKLDGLPDFYQTAYHTREYIAREWTQDFELLQYVERAINDHQDWGLTSEAIIEMKARKK